MATCWALVLRDCSSSDASCFSDRLSSASWKLASDTFCTHTWMYFLRGSKGDASRWRVSAEQIMCIQIGRKRCGKSHERSISHKKVKSLFIQGSTSVLLQVPIPTIASRGLWVHFQYWRHKHTMVTFDMYSLSNGLVTCFRRRGGSVWS